MTAWNTARWTALLAVIVSLACGSSGRAPEVHHVDIEEMQYVPAELSVAIGDIITWTNRDVVPHTVTAAGIFDSQLIASKQRWTYTVTAAGELPYVCTYHPTMQAKLTVR